MPQVDWDAEFSSAGLTATAPPPPAPVAPVEKKVPPRAVDWDNAFQEQGFVKETPQYTGKIPAGSDPYEDNHPVIQSAKKYLGTPYQMPPGPGTLDCSLFVQRTYGDVGVSLPRTAQKQYLATERVDKPRPGDLVFLQGTQSDKPKTGYATHVMIYAGGGKLIQAASGGRSKEVRFDGLNSSYAQKHFLGFGRVKGTPAKVKPSASPFLIPDGQQAPTVVAMNTTLPALWRISQPGKPVKKGKPVRPFSVQDNVPTMPRGTVDVPGAPPISNTRITRNKAAAWDDPLELQKYNNLTPEEQAVWNEVAAQQAAEGRRNARADAEIIRNAFAIATGGVAGIARAGGTGLAKVAGGAIAGEAARAGGNALKGKRLNTILENDQPMGQGFLGNTQRAFDKTLVQREIGEAIQTGDTDRILNLAREMKAMEDAGETGIVADSLAGLASFGPEIAGMTVGGKINRLAGVGVLLHGNYDAAHASAMADAFTHAGADLTNPDSVNAVLTDPQAMDTIHQYAIAKGVPEAVVNTAGMELGGVLAGRVAPQGVGIGRAALGVLANQSVQALGMGGGYAAGQMAVGEPIDPATLASTVGTGLVLGGLMEAPRIGGAIGRAIKGKPVTPRLGESRLLPESPERLALPADIPSRGRARTMPNAELPAGTEARPMGGTVAKEPWRMTREEYDNSLTPAEKVAIKNVGVIDGKWDYPVTILNALEKGLPVPDANVRDAYSQYPGLFHRRYLNNYPDIQREFDAFARPQLEQAIAEGKGDRVSQKHREDYPDLFPSEQSTPVAPTSLQGAELPAGTEPIAMGEKAPETTKEPWQMSEAEFEAASEVHRGNNFISVDNGDGTNFIIRSLDTSKYTDADARKAARKDYVRSATEKGLPVPPEVSADFPDLQPAPPAATPTKLKGKPPVEPGQGGVPYFRKLGEQDATDPARKRMRSVPQNYKLAYIDAWYAAKKAAAPVAEVKPAPPEAPAPVAKGKHGKGGVKVKASDAISQPIKDRIIAQIDKALDATGRVALQNDADGMQWGVQRASGGKFQTVHYDTNYKSWDESTTNRTVYYPKRKTLAEAVDNALDVMPQDGEYMSMVRKADTPKETATAPAPKGKPAQPRTAEAEGEHVANADGTIFIRASSVYEAKSPTGQRDAINKMPAREGYKIAHKPYGPDGEKSGRGFYYIPDTPYASRVAPKEKGKQGAAKQTAKPEPSPKPAETPAEATEPKPEATDVKELLTLYASAKKEVASAEVALNDAKKLPENATPQAVDTSAYEVKQNAEGLWRGFVDGKASTPGFLSEEGARNYIKSLNSDETVRARAVRQTASAQVDKERAIKDAQEKLAAARKKVQNIKESAKASHNIDDLDALSSKRNPSPEPVSTPQPKPEATGLANQVQARQAKAGIIEQPKSRGGKSIEEMQKAGREAVDAGADYMDLAERIGSGEEAPTDKAFGILLEGDRLLLNEYNRAKKALDAKPGTPDLIVKYEQAKQTLRDYRQNVATGKTAASDTFRALQAGTELDTGNFAQVLEEVRRMSGKEVSPELEARLKEQTAKVQELSDRLTAAEERLSKAEAGQSARDYRRTRRARTVKVLDDEFDNLLKQAAALGSKLSAGVDPQALVVVGKMVANRIERGAVSLAQVIDDLLPRLRETFPDITDRDIRDAFSGYSKEAVPKTRTAVQQKLSKLRTEARLLSQIEDAIEGKYPEKGKRQPTPQRIATLRKQLDTILREKGVRTSGSNLTPEEARYKRLSESLDRLKKGETRTARPQPTSPRIEAVIKEKGKIIEKRRAAATMSRLKGKLAAAERGEKPAVTPQKADPKDVAAIKAQIAEIRTKNDLKEQIQALEARLKSKDFTGMDTPERKAASAEVEELRFRRDQASKEVQRAIRNAQPKSLGDIASEVWNSPRSLQASSDLSFSLRQGLVGLTKSPTRWAQAQGQALKSVFSEKTAFQVQRSIEESPLYMKAKKARLYIAPYEGGIVQREEAFISHLVQKAPVIGPVVRASERHYVTMGNKLRFDLFADFAKRYPDAPKETLDAYAGYLNAITGRGELRGKHAKYDPALSLFSSVLYSPRFVLSRFQSPAYVAKFALGKSPALRKEALQDLAKFTATVGSALGLAVLAGKQVSLDPDSPDFLKIRRGDTRYDVLAGYQQELRLALRILKGIGNPKARPPSELVSKFFTYKLAPGISAAQKLSTGKDVVGNKVTPRETITGMFTPLSWQEVAEAFSKEGIDTGTTSVGISNILGIGTSVYTEKGKSYGRRGPQAPRPPR